MGARPLILQNTCLQDARNVLDYLQMEKKYTITNITHPDNPKLRRIKALRDFGDVKAGDLGGWIESERNLSHDRDCWVSHNAKVYDNATVYDNAKVFGNVWVYDNAKVCGNAKVYDNAKVCGNAWVFDNAKVFGKAWVSGRAQVSGKAEISGKADLFARARISDDAKVSSDSLAT